MTAIQHAPQYSLLSRIGSAIFAFLKLLFIYALGMFFAYNVDCDFFESELSNGQFWVSGGILLFGHIALQAVCAIKTTYGTREFVIWQTIAFVGVFFASSFTVLNALDPGGVIEAGKPIVYYLGRYIVDSLPFFLPFHAFTHLIFVAAARNLEHRQNPNASGAASKPFPNAAICIALKLLSLYALFQIYYKFSNGYALLRNPFYNLIQYNEPSDLFQYAVILAGHLIVLLVCSHLTVYGTRPFAVWQIISFFGVIAVHVFSFANTVPDYSIFRSPFAFSIVALRCLPIVLILHAAVQLLFIAAVRYRRKRKVGFT